MLIHMDEANTASELAKRVTLKDAIGWLSLAWTALNPATITKCFVKCGFQCAMEVPESSEPSVGDPEEDLPLAQLKPLLGEVTWDQFVEMDRDVSTTPDIQPDWEEAIIASVTSGHIPTAVTDSDSDCSDDDATPISITASKAVSNMSEMVDFAMTTADPDMLEVATKLQSMVHDFKLKKMGQSKQSHIRDFFMIRSK
jgi:hypothetical protein